MQPFDNIVQTFHICSLHFSLSDFKVNGKRKTVLPGRVPTIFSDSSVSNEPIDVHGTKFDVNVGDIIRIPGITNLQNDAIENSFEETLELSVDTSAAGSLNETDNTPTLYFADTDFDFADENNPQSSNLETENSCSE